MPKKTKHPTILLAPQDIPDEMYIVGLDLAKWLTGLAVVKANLATNARTLTAWKLLNADNECTHRYHKSYQYTYIGYWLINMIEDFLRENARWQSDDIFLAIETVFLGRNAHTMIDTAYIRGAVACSFNEWYVKGRAIDITPSTMKMTVTRGYEGNGHSPKPHIASILKEKYAITDDTFTDMTTLQKPKSIQTVYDVSDALGLADTLVTELRYKKGYV